MNQLLAIIPCGRRNDGTPMDVLRRVAGRSLLAHTIAQAEACPPVGRIVVLAQDAATEAEVRGTRAEWLRWQVVGDPPGPEGAARHVLESLQRSGSREPDGLIVLNVAVPQRRLEDLQAAVERFAEGDVDTLFSATELRRPLWSTLDGDLSRVSSPAADGAVLLADNGSFRVLRPGVVRRSGEDTTARTLAFPTSDRDGWRCHEPGGEAAIEAVLVARERERACAVMAGVGLLVLDFDGVMTDNRVLVDHNGVEAVSCSRSDGWGISRLRKVGFDVVVLSTETNPVVQARCRKLGIPCVSGSTDKLEHIRAIASERSLAAREIAFVGNDLNDEGVMGWVGVPIAVADAYPEIRAMAALVTTRPGGDGAVREVADWLLAAHGENPEPG